MNDYDPSIEPDKQSWLEATEGERIAVVTAFHEKHDKKLDRKALIIHSAVHVVVENQLALGVELLPETVARLIRQGLSRHEAIHAVGAIISGDILGIIRGEITEFSASKYRIKLEKISAKRWRKEKY
jgi:hypothetical protein